MTPVVGWQSSRRATPNTLRYRKHTVRVVPSGRFGVFKGGVLLCTRRTLRDALERIDDPISAGDGRTPECVAWDGIKTRCNNPNSRAYHRYGGRGIRLCQEWQGSFAAFLAHVGPRPGPGYSIDRIDNDRGYEPGNVRWATAKQQANNTRANIRVTVGGVTKTPEEWSRIYGVRARLIRQRVWNGWDGERAVRANLGGVSLRCEARDK